MTQCSMTLARSHPGSIETISMLMYVIINEHVFGKDTDEKQDAFFVI